MFLNGKKKESLFQVTTPSHLAVSAKGLESRNVAFESGLKVEVSVEPWPMRIE